MKRVGGSSMLKSADISQVSTLTSVFLSPRAPPPNKNSTRCPIKCGRPRSCGGLRRAWCRKARRACWTRGCRSRRRSRTCGSPSPQCCAGWRALWRPCARPGACSRPGTTTRCGATCGAVWRSRACWTWRRPSGRRGLASRAWWTRPWRWSSAMRMVEVAWAEAITRKQHPSHRPLSPRWRSRRGSRTEATEPRCCSTSCCWRSATAAMPWTGACSG